MATQPSAWTGEKPRRKSGNAPGRGWPEQNGGPNGGGQCRNNPNGQHSFAIHRQALPVKFASLLLHRLVPDTWRLIKTSNGEPSPLHNGVDRGYAVLACSPTGSLRIRLPVAA